jgi:plasmid maintenance system antidote protein VapI
MSKNKKKYKLINMLDEKGSNQIKLAELLDISYPAIQNKINGRSEFKADEIAKIKETYNLTLEEVEDIFFEG